MAGIDWTDTTWMKELNVGYSKINIEPAHGDQRSDHCQCRGEVRRQSSCPS